jgi:hypothetical protein
LEGLEPDLAAFVSNPVRQVAEIAKSAEGNRRRDPLDELRRIVRSAGHGRLPLIPVGIVVATRAVDEMTDEEVAEARAQLWRNLAARRESAEQLLLGDH